LMSRLDLFETFIPSVDDLMSRLYQELDVTEIEDVLPAVLALKNSSHASVIIDAPAGTTSLTISPR